MKIYKLPIDWGSIMRKAIILIEVITIILLLIAATPKAETQEQKYFIMEATGYYPGEECCYPFTDGLTATGAKAGRGCIAIDPKAGILKMGQVVYIEGYGYGTCNDVGGAIKGWKIDLCFNTLQEAKEWGVKLAKVYIIEGSK